MAISNRVGYVDSFTFDELNVGDTFLFHNEPYIKVGASGKKSNLNCVNLENGTLFNFNKYIKENFPHRVKCQDCISANFSLSITHYN